MVLAFACVRVHADGGTNAMFWGGWYDGWDCDASVGYAELGGPEVRLASASDQVLDWHFETQPLENVTITEDASRPGIKNNAVLVISLPAELPGLRFDSSSKNCSYSGTAAKRVGAATLSGDERSLRVPVTQDFAPADTLTISGLVVRDPHLNRQGSGWLGLEFSGIGAPEVVDEKSITVRFGISGGAYDGWDSDATPEYFKLMF